MLAGRSCRFSSEYFFPLIVSSVPSSLHIPLYSLSLLAALRIGLKHFHSALVVLLYSLSTYIPQLRNFLLLYTWFASAFFTKTTEIGHPLIGLHLPSQAVDTISSFLAFSSFSSSVSEPLQLQCLIFHGGVLLLQIWIPQHH